MKIKFFGVLKTQGIQPMEGHAIIIEPLFDSSVLYLFNISSTVAYHNNSYICSISVRQLPYQLLKGLLLHIAVQYQFASYQFSYPISSPVTNSVTISATKCMVEPRSSSNKESVLRNVVTCLGAGAFPSLYIR